MYYIPTCRVTSKVRFNCAVRLVKEALIVVENRGTRNSTGNHKREYGR